MINTHDSEVLVKNIVKIRLKNILISYLHYDKKFKYKNKRKNFKTFVYIFKY